MKRHRVVGKLSELMNMPLDVFLEVASHLHPLDLLHLARTSKSLRAVVFSRNSASAWIASMGAIKNLPDCPADLDLPSYAALLFDKHCFLCGAGRATWVDYAIRLRLCKECCQANIQKGSNILGEDATRLRFLGCVPCETGNNYKEANKLVDPKHHRPSNKYFVPQVQELVKTLDEAGDEGIKQLEMELTVNIQRRHLHAAMVLLWKKEVADRKVASDAMMAAEWYSNVVEKLKDLGHPEEDFPTTDEEWDKLAKQPKELTERAWNSIRPKLEEKIAVIREKRIQAAYQERLNCRFETISKYYEDFITANVSPEDLLLMPNAYDGARLPCLRALAEQNNGEGPVSKDNFLAVSHQILADAHAYQSQAKEQLTAILRQSVPRIGDDVPADDALQQYCAYFACKMAGCWTWPRPKRTYPELHAHWRETHPSVEWMGWLEKGSGDRYRAVEVSLHMHITATDVLTAVGIPLDTTYRALDEWVRSGRLYCACEDPTMPPPAELGWVRLVEHVVLHLEEHDFRTREKDALRTQKKHEHVLESGHCLEPGSACCIKFLAEDADRSPASARIALDDALRAKVEERIAARPDPNAVLSCRVCKALTRKARYENTRFHARLGQSPEEIVWHLRTCHAKEFEKRDIVFRVF